MKRIEPSVKDLGEFRVERFIPSQGQRMVGPFVFFDHLPPASFAPGKGINVRPHPHTGLSTLTYLFKGEILHRDSIGSVQLITPGAVNWMTAGRGIVHSERDTHEARARDSSLHALQAWVALPKHKKDEEPSFTHISRNELPVIYFPDQMIRLIAGSAYGRTAPISSEQHTFCDIVYLDIVAKQGSKLALPSDGVLNDKPAYRELAILVVQGEVSLNSDHSKLVSQGEIYYLESAIAKSCELELSQDSRVIIFGGVPWESSPLLEWNFLAWSKEDMERHKEDWANNRFATIPYDDYEYIPLP